VTDGIIAQFESEEDNDLTLCPFDGVAYQTDMKITASYDADYFNKCAGYEDKEIALKINAGRIAMVNEHAGADVNVLDVGIGSGEFIKKRPHTFGFDVNPVAIDWLKSCGLFASDLERFSAFTFWDVLEHVESPAFYFGPMAGGSFVFVSIPIFSNLKRIRQSRHYRPGEHLYYFTETGFTDWMAMNGFHLIDRQDFEMKAGRENIVSFAFRKWWWP
jgi:hypothetical protein